MTARSLFRDVRMPSEADQRHAYERFLLDTYADRRQPARETKAGALARRLRRMLLEGGK